MGSEPRWPGPLQPELGHRDTTLADLIDWSAIPDDRLRLLRVVLGLFRDTTPPRPRWLVQLAAWLFTPPPPAPEPAPTPAPTTLPLTWIEGYPVPPGVRSADVRRMDSRDLDDAFASALSGAPPEIAEALRMLSAALAKPQA